MEYCLEVEKVLAVLHMIKIYIRNETCTFRAVVYCVSAKFSHVINSNSPKYFFAPT